MSAETDPTHKHIDQESVLEGAMVQSVTLRSPASVPSDIFAVLKRANTGGTTVVNVPTDVMQAVAGTASAQVDLYPGTIAEAPDPSDVHLVVDLLEAAGAARRPVILAGRGALRSGARSELIRLADQIGALLGTTLLAKSLFAGHLFHFGLVGGFSSSVGLDLLREADLLLAFGTSLNPMTTLRGELFPKARVVQIDSSVKAFGSFLEPDIKVRGDARLTALALADALVARSYRSEGYRTPEVAQRIAEYRVEDSVRDQGQPGALDPRFLMMEIEKILPTRRTLVLDSGHQFSFPVTFLSAPDVHSFIFPHDGGALGGALSVALGAAVATPDRLTVLCIGDGGLMMSLADLDTAVRYRLPLLIIVSNNSAFASEVFALRAAGLPDELARYTNPSFEAVARALGADGVTVATLEDVRRLRGRVTASCGPLLMDCQVTIEVRAEWADFVYDTTVPGDWAASR